MATKKRNSSGQNYTNNSDGFSLAGGTTERKLDLSGGDVTVVGGGSNTLTFPSSTDTIVARNTTDTLTNKTITGLQVTAGSTTVPPVRLSTGTALITPLDGSIEYHGSHIYFTIGSTRYQLDQQAGGVTTEIEIDFGNSVPVTSKRFIITDVLANTTSKIIVNPSGNIATGRVGDDWEWDCIDFAVKSGTGNFVITAKASGRIKGKRKIFYRIF